MSGFRNCAANEAAFFVEPGGSTDVSTGIQAAISDAANALANGAQGANVQLGPGIYTWQAGAATTMTAAIGLKGDSKVSTLINLIPGSAVGNGFSRNQTANWNANGSIVAAPIEKFTMDGQALGSTLAQSGIFDQDVTRYNYSHLLLRNFTGPLTPTGTAQPAGINQFLNTWWAERGLGFDIEFLNCTVHHLQDGGVSTGPPSFDYSDWFAISNSLKAGQIARLLRNNAQCVGGSYFAHVNALLSGGADQYFWQMGTLGAGSDNSNITNAHLGITGETDGAGGNAYDINVSAVSGFLAFGNWELTGTWQKPSGMQFADCIMTGAVNTPSMNRLLMGLVSPGSSPTQKGGTWSSNQSNKYGLVIPQAQGGTTANGVAQFTSIGPPTFTTGVQTNDKCWNQTGTLGTFLYNFQAGAWVAIL
jgi:hypothetical protein